jgi:acyl carrier protein
MNTTIKELKQVFAIALNIPENSVPESIEYQSIPEWDSITHMVLVSELEDKYNISIETDDVVDLSSFVKAIEIIAKYGVAIE